MAISTGEGYSLLGQGFSQAAQGNLSDRKKLMKEAQRRQLMTAALTPIAQGVGQFATDLISAPFKDPAKRFMTTDYGKKLKRAKKLRRTDQSQLSAETKRISDSGMGGMNLYTQEAEERVVAGFKKKLGSDYTSNEEFYSSQVNEQATANAKKRYAAYQDAVSKSSRVFSDAEWEESVTKYGSESPNAAVSLWRGAKRLVGVGKSNEEYRKEAFDNVVDTMELDSYLDEKDPAFIELRKQISTGMRPFSSSDIVKQIGENNKDNPIFQEAVKTADAAKRDYITYSELFPDVTRDFLAASDGNIRKGLASIRSQIKENAKLPDASSLPQQKFYIGMYTADANLTGDKVERLRQDFHAKMGDEDYVNLSEKSITDNTEAVEEQLQSSLTGVYAEATRLTEIELFKLKQTDKDLYNKNFADGSASKLNKDALILSNMDKIMEYSLEEKEQILEKGFNSVASLQTGRILKEPFDPEKYRRHLNTVEQAPEVVEEDEARTLDPNSDALAASTVVPNVVPTVVPLGSLDKMKSMYDSGSTAQAFEMGRNAIRQDVKNQQGNGNFKTAEEAVEYGLLRANELGRETGIPDLSTYGSASRSKNISTSGSLFAKDGDSVTVEIGGNSKSLLGKTVDSPDAKYTITKDSGQINVSVSQPGIANKRSLKLAEIPEGNIKNHLTFLKLQYQKNIETLGKLGVDDPSSRSLSDLGGEGRSLKIENNRILGAIDLPGLGDREDVITFLTEQTSPQTSLISDPADEKFLEEKRKDSRTIRTTGTFPFDEPEVSVVEAAAAEVSKMFNDGGAATALLRETAIQESNMGQTDGTYTLSDADGEFGRGSFGVSQVDERTFNDTLSRLRGDKGQPRNLVKWVDIIKDKTDINLTEVTYRELSDPTLSLIFSRLHYLKVADPVPPTAAGRSKYWKKHYNTSAGAGTSKEYLDNQEAFQKVYGE